MWIHEVVGLLVEGLPEANASIDCAVFAWIEDEARNDDFHYCLDGVHGKDREQCIVRPVDTPLVASRFSWIIDVARRIDREDNRLYDDQKQDERLSHWVDKTAE